MVSQEQTQNSLIDSFDRQNHNDLTDLIRQRAWVEINHSALTHNIQTLNSLLKPTTQIIAVVKADAYGHGAIRCAETALEAGVTTLAVATLSEGIELREAGITANIILLGAINTPEEIKAVIHWQLQPTLCHYQQALITAKTATALGTTIPVHVKIDTGMSRLGTLWSESIDFMQTLSQYPSLTIKSLYSHLATADDPNTDILHLQHQRFNHVIQQLKTHHLLPPKLHLSNSAGTLMGEDYHYDFVRIGLALYGLYPAPHLTSKIDLKPVLEVKAKITQIKTIPQGTGVSYGYQYVTQKDTKIAVVGIGYADGIPRLLSNKLKVLLRGQWVQQIGAITMDQIMLDISHLDNIQVGEIITLIGKDGLHSISADDWANEIGTISWEILCGFKHRLPRINL